MASRPYPLRIPQGLLELAHLKSKEEHTDKTTALRQWLYTSAETYALKQLSEGQLTLSRAAELLEMSVYDVQRLACERGFPLGATVEQYQNALETARQLGPKQSGKV